MTLRIAMWSGPRNISTAMMRSWENRPDCSVVDEPFYAAYLADTGLAHPCREQILLSQSTDHKTVVAELTEQPVSSPVQYQKQMTHHIPRGMNMAWCIGLKHCFLIRDPYEMLLSLSRKMPRPTLADTGLPQQVEIYEMVWNRTGVIPPVIDSRDVLLDPEGMLRLLCERLGVPFVPEMLSWPAGRRSTDGIWLEHWYADVEKSTRFQPYRPKTEPLPEHLIELHEQCKKPYRELYNHRIVT